MSTDQDSAFEKRARELLAASTDTLDAGTRSRLARARAAALAAHESPRGWLTLRQFAPAGAVAAAVVLAVFYMGRLPQTSPVNGGSGLALDDLELLADADALDMSEEPDLEFIEWAAAMSQRGQGG